MMLTIVNFDGWIQGQINANYVPEGDLRILIEDPIPSTTLAHMHKWRWSNDVNAWVQCLNREGHRWYNPVNTKQTFMALAPNDEPPVGWSYWPDGSSPVSTQNEINEEMWNKIRIKRNRILRETDWVTLKAMETGAPLDDIWIRYRQDLRDITFNSNPANVVWPVNPMPNML